MTMRHILSHTAGLTYGALLPIDPHPVDAVYQQLGVQRGDGETSVVLQISWHGYLATTPALNGCIR